MPRLFSYLMTHDSGFAPNPFYESLTLATCMAEIRRTKVVGDWVAGFASKALVKKCAVLNLTIPHQGLIYLMEVGEINSLGDYFHDVRFQRKKAVLLDGDDLISKRGDNIYQLNERGLFEQLENDNHDEGEMLKDTNGKNVLIAKRFYYFGRACPLPAQPWSDMAVRVPDRYIAPGSESQKPALENLWSFLTNRGYTTGVHGIPCIWEPGIAENGMKS